MSRPRPHVAYLLVLLALLSACATKPVGWGRGRLSEVQVINDLIPPRLVTVEIAAAQGGSRRVLGSVAPSQTRSFNYAPTVPGAEYIITSKDSEGHEIKSATFPLQTDETVVWSLRHNQLVRR